MKVENITLEPGDILQLKIGLKIENVGGNCITFEMPSRYEVFPMIIKNSTPPATAEMPTSRTAISKLVAKAEEGENE